MANITYEAHEVWGAVMTWWQGVIPAAVETFGERGAGGAVDWRRYQYSEEEVEELRAALTLKSVSSGHKARIEKGLVGSILWVLAGHECGLEDLRLRINLDNKYDRAHPKWSKVLIRELQGRRVFVWVSPASEDED